MNPYKSAALLLSRGQKICLTLFVLVAILLAVVFGPYFLLQAMVAAATVFYVVFVGFKLIVALKSARHRFTELPPVPPLNSRTFPRYAVMVPLFRETAVFDGLVNALKGLYYPASQLDIYLLVEASDPAMLEKVNGTKLPHNFEIVKIPQGLGPQTKPKACTFAYDYVMKRRSDTKYLVVYDAEDRMDPYQLVRAVQVFEVSKDDTLGCLQAVLAFWNPRHSLVSSFYWAEYVNHFRWVLVGLAKLRLIPPLGGTSNHFRIEALEAVTHYNGDWLLPNAEGKNQRVRGPWDPYNVTEDADLAARLYAAGFRIDMLNTVTEEEAPDRLRKARNQRSRWLKGYLQTFLVHTRAPFSTIRQMGLKQFLVFNLFMGGTPLALLLNPVTWGTTLTYLASRLFDWVAVTAFIEGLFPPVVYYLGLLALLGNIPLFCLKLMTTLKAQEVSESASDWTELSHSRSQDEYGLTGRLLLTPFWWLFTSLSAYQALYELLHPQRRTYWRKTEHGHAQQREAEITAASTRNAIGRGATLPDPLTGKVAELNPQQRNRPDASA